jgi:chromate reductase, NAD(P)H dehydrogenase (quinone)
MKIGIIIGSHRADSQSTKVGKFLGSLLQAEKAQIELIDLAGNPLPLWDETAWNPESDLAKQFAPYAESLKACDGYVVVAPEWGGMVPAGLKNFFLFTNANHVGHKPALITGVSAAGNGVYPVAELRGSSYKNSKIVYVPDHLIVRNVKDVMNGAPASDPDTYIQTRAAHSVRMLLAYAAALKPVRDNADAYHKDYPYGM